MARYWLTYTPFSAILERMEYIARIVEKRLADMLARGRSALLLGARQTGKTTLAQRLNPNMQLNFIRPEVRQRYERRPELLGAEIESLPVPPKRKLPLVLLDEVQRVPELVNVVQDLIDRRAAQFILTGSSARKLRHGRTPTGSQGGSCRCGWTR